MATVQVLPSHHVQGQAVWPQPFLAGHAKEGKGKVTLPSLLTRRLTVNHLHVRSSQMLSLVGNSCGHPLAVSASMETEFTSPKTGTVGEDRFRESAAPGTYWSCETNHLGGPVLVAFVSNAEERVEQARVGENLLRVAERCGVLTPNADFCFEGTCCHCEMDVKGGAREVGYRADISGGSIVRSCICPVPSRQQVVEVSILSEDDAWGEGVL